MANILPEEWEAAIEKALAEAHRPHPQPTLIVLLQSAFLQKVLALIAWILIFCAIPLGRERQGLQSFISCG
jgi:hypothetical protein